MKNFLVILILMMSFEGKSQNLPLNAGSAYPLSGPLYHSGNSYIRRSLTPTYFGYSSSYRVLMLGSASTTYTTQEEGSVTLSFGYDPSSNTNGAFTGDGREILFRNGVAFTTPNATNNGYHLNNLVLKDGNVGIGASSPLDRLHLYTGPNPAYGTSGGITISDSYTVGRLWDSGGGHDIGTLDLFNNGNQMVRMIANGDSYINGGRVGIGKTNPATSLDVNGSVQSSGQFILDNNSGNDIINKSATGNLRLGWGTYGIPGGAVLGTDGDQPLIFATAYAEKMRMSASGNLGIGTSQPTEKLSVNGNVRAKKVIVSQSGWPDYVFDPNYKLQPLIELAAFIKKHKHLPDIPSAKEVEEKGVSVGDQQALLLNKIEELTLYVIDLQKQIHQLKNKNQDK